jgi:hypothetical protein
MTDEEKREIEAHDEWARRIAEKARMEDLQFCISMIVGSISLLLAIFTLLRVIL